MYREDLTQIWATPTEGRIGVVISDRRDNKEILCVAKQLDQQNSSVWMGQAKDGSVYSESMMREAVATEGQDDDADSASVRSVASAPAEDTAPVGAFQQGGSSSSAGPATGQRAPLPRFRQATPAQPLAELDIGEYEDGMILDPLT